MPKLARLQLSFALTCLYLLVFIPACGNPSTMSDNASPRLPNAAVSTPIATPTSATSTVCPVSGSGRPAVMPALQLGTHQQIVYYHNIDNQMVLDIFDTQRKAVVAITGQNEHIQTAQLSSNGQWVLMVVNANNMSELQLVRTDGKFFQTLYCAPTGQQIDSSNTTGTQWSPDLQHIIFAQAPNLQSPQSLYMLNLTSGKVQLELSSASTDLTLLPATWLDNIRVYLVDRTRSNLLLLDTSQGPTQHYSDLKLIRGPGDATWDFDTSVDGTKLFISSCIYNPGPGDKGADCQIMVMSPTGENSKMIYNSHATFAIHALRVIDSSSLMFAVYERSGNLVKYNGFWKINADGRGLTHLNSLTGSGHWGLFNPYTQYIWSNFSRNDSFYTDGLSFGSLHGGSLTQYASDGEGDGNILVGWTLNPIYQ